MRIPLFALLLVALTATAQKPGVGLTALPDKPQAPDFQLSDVDGNTHRLSDYRGRAGDRQLLGHLVPTLSGGDALHAAGLGNAATGRNPDARRQCR